MNRINTFMEGGGPSAGRGSAIRQGMDAFLAAIKAAARDKGIRWKLIPCGSRDTTRARFQESSDRTAASVANLLLVDAEAEMTASDPRIHLLNRDKWNLNHCPAAAIHLMVQVMETWIVADPNALARYYGQGFSDSSLPKRPNLEEAPKEQVLRGLHEATKRATKGRYHKVDHARELLGLIDPARVQARCPHCKRLFDELHRIIAAA